MLSACWASTGSALGGRVCPSTGRSRSQTTPTPSLHVQSAHTHRGDAPARPRVGLFVLLGLCAQCAPLHPSRSPSDTRIPHLVGLCRAPHLPPPYTTSASLPAALARARCGSFISDLTRGAVSGGHHPHLRQISGLCEHEAKGGQQHKSTQVPRDHGVRRSHHKETHRSVGLQIASDRGNGGRRPFSGKGAASGLLAGEGPDG